MDMAKSTGDRAKRVAGKAPKSHKLKVQQWEIGRLVEYPDNPRDNDHAVARMSDTIRQFGFRVPIVATSDGEVVDGHLRLKAARALGLKEVPVALADDLSDVQVKAFRLVANQSSSWAHWNPELLKVELGKLEEMNFDLQPFGFDEIELPEMASAEPAPKARRNKITIFLSVKIADAERARKVAASALTKARIEHNL